LAGLFSFFSPLTSGNQKTFKIASFSKNLISIILIFSFDFARNARQLKKKAGCWVLE
jgi:hypothetical protein